MLENVSECVPPQTNRGSVCKTQRTQKCRYQRPCTEAGDSDCNGFYFACYFGAECVQALCLRVCKSLWHRLCNDAHVALLLRKHAAQLSPTGQNNTFQIQFTSVHSTRTACVPFVFLLLLQYCVVVGLCSVRGTAGDWAQEGGSHSTHTNRTRLRSSRLSWKQI